MGHLDWARPCFVVQGNQQHSAISKADQIMAKYRPIAPKPPLSSLGKPTSDSSSISALHFLSTFHPTHNSNSNRRSGYKRKLSHSSPTLLKKTRGTPSLGINPDIVLSRVELHGQTPTHAKEVKANGSSVLDERSMSTKADDVSVVEVAETRCGRGSADFFVFPIVGEKKKNLVTLPLFTPTPQLQNVSHHASSASNNASSNRQGIPLRLFGRDLGYKEIGSCQSSMNNESPEPGKVVPIVGLSFI